jgi:YfiR/HmsC-like
MNFIFKLRRLFAAVLIGQLFALSGQFTARAQTEYQVKAAFLYNFGKFVQWPTNAFASSNAPLVIGVFGANPFNNDLDDIVRGRNIAGHPVVVKQIAFFSDLKDCHILFICASERDRLGGVLHELDGRSVLTVTENQDPDQFSKSGAMINFITEDKKIHFEINDAAAERVGLKISSKLLMLAERPAVSREDKENRKLFCARFP